MTSKKTFFTIRTILSERSFFLFLFNCHSLPDVQPSAVTTDQRRVPVAAVDPVARHGHTAGPAHLGAHHQPAGDHAHLQRVGVAGGEEEDPRGLGRAKGQAVVGLLHLLLSEER